MKFVSSLVSIMLVLAISAVAPTAKEQSVVEFTATPVHNNTIETLDLMSETATAMGSREVRIVWYSPDPITPSAEQRIWGAIDDVQASVDEASGGSRRIRFSDEIEWIDGMAGQPNDVHSYWDIHQVISPEPGERVIAILSAFTETNICGQGAQPTTAEELYTGAYVATVYGNCFYNGLTILHELFHNLGAVHDDAPNSDGNSHIDGTGDLMSIGNCYERRFRAIDCFGDNYFNVNPESGGFLDTNPEWNIAFSPWVEEVEVNPDEYRGGRGVRRVSGFDRFETAVQVSRQNYEAGAHKVYIVNGNAMADALVIDNSDGPVLYVRQDSIPAVTWDELERLQPYEIIVVGGTGVVSEQVQAELSRFTR